MNITILGAGAWGTALAAHTARCHNVVLWGRDPQVIETINNTQQNTRYLPNIVLPTTLKAQTDFNQALAHGISGLVVLAAPLAGLAHLCKEIATSGQMPRHLIWACKGVEPKTLALPHQVITRELPYPHLNDGPKIGTLSGPSFAQEIARGLPCALVAASPNTQLQTLCQEAFHHHMMRVYVSQDLIGVELGGAIKNVLAIAAGISDGLELGLNARAALLTRGLAEMTRLGLALGAKIDTFSGLAGIGDLILTATGNLSRNRTVGLELAKGKSLATILQELGHVAEGVYCAQAVQELAQRHQIEMPICNTIAHALAQPEAIDLHTLIAQLFARDPKVESVS